MADACRSCGRRVRWALTPKGERTPVDFEPDATANTLLLAPSVLAGELLAVVLSGEMLERVRSTPGRVLFMNHWATCPDRARWRERTDEKKKVAGA